MKSRYQVACMSRENGREYYYECEATSAPGAIRKIRAMLREGALGEFVIREVYCI